MRLVFSLVKAWLTICLMLNGLAAIGTCSEFVFGGYNAYMPIDHGAFKACGFNAIAAKLTVDQYDQYSGIRTLADSNLIVLSLNDLNTWDKFEYSHIFEASLGARSIHWEAEVESSVPVYGVTTDVAHLKGHTAGAVWYVDTTDSPGLAWQLTTHYQSRSALYTALFYLAIDSLGPAGDTVAELIIEDQDFSYSVSRTVTVQDFAAPDSLHTIELDYQRSETPGLWRADISIVWHGTRQLSMDSLVIFDVNGWELMRNPQSELKARILEQVALYDSVHLPGDSITAVRWWPGVEDMEVVEDSGCVYLDRLEPARYLDSLIEMNSSGQGFVWDRNGGRSGQFRGEDSFYLAMQPRYYLTFCYPFMLDGIETVPPDSGNLDSLNVLYDSLAYTLAAKRKMTEEQGVPMYYVAQACAKKASGQGDRKRPTTAELKCLSFLGVCYGVDGLWYWPYDERADTAWSGLVTRVSGDSLTAKYYAVRDAIGPFVHRYADTLINLSRQGAGRIGTILTEPWSPVRDVSFHDLTDPYVEAGLFEAPGVADYVVLVNRNTSDSLNRTLTVTIDESYLTTPGSTHYYVIDMNPTYAGSTQDTLLAGPRAGLMKYTTKIDPGGAKLLKVVAAPSAIAGTNFPERWWGSIHAGGALTVSSGRHLRMAPGTQLTVHTDGWGDGLMVQGQLTAMGNEDSLIEFGFDFDGVPCDSEIVNCDGFDSTHWDGITFQASAPCSLSHCVLSDAAQPLYNNIGGDIVLRNVTTAGSGPVAYEQDGGLVSVNAADCSFDGAIKIRAGSAWLQGITIDSSTLGVYAVNPGQSTDSVTLIGCHFSHIDSIAIMADDVPLKVMSCSVTVAGTGIRATNTQIWIDSTLITDATEGIRLDSAGYTWPATANVLSDCPIGIVLNKGFANLRYLTITGSDTAVVSDPGDPQLLAIYKGDISGCTKGIVSRSGTLGLVDCTIESDSLSAIDAFTGTTLLRLDSCQIQAASNNGAAVTVGPNARVSLATRCEIQDSYIGFELKSEGADTIIDCQFTDNALYGIWFDAGDSVDYSADNVIENTAATALNVGVHVLQQSIISDGDLVLGGYNWDFNINTYNTSNKNALINDLVVAGKSGDDWGLVLNGIYSSYDTAVVNAAVVNDTFVMAHLYVRQIHAEVTDSRFESTNDTSASTYGAVVKEGNTGFFGCTGFIGQWQCVQRQSAASNLYWTDVDAPYEDAGFNTFATDLTYTFANLASDTVDARDCYWGDTIPNKIYGHVRTDPWLDSAGCGGGGPLAKMSAIVAALPETFELAQNYPNPFNPTTMIGFSLPIDQSVRIEIYNILGRRVRLFDLGVVPAGYSSVKWDGTLQTGQPVGSGVYLYRISTPEFMDTKKMLLLK